MARLRYNLVETTLAAGIDDNDTAVTFSTALQESGVDIPTVAAPDYLPITLSGSEIVWLTAYTTGATSGTIERNPTDEDQVPITHLTGASVQHNPTKLDFTGGAAAFDEEKDGTTTFTEYNGVAGWQGFSAVSGERSLEYGMWDSGTSYAVTASYHEDDFAVFDVASRDGSARSKAAIGAATIANGSGESGTEDADAALRLEATDSGGSTSAALLILTDPTGTVFQVQKDNSAGYTNVMAMKEGGSETPQLGFFGTAASGKPTVTGSRGGNAALASLLTALAGLGLITDSTTA